MSSRKRYHLITKNDHYDVDAMDDVPELLLEIKNLLQFKTVPIIWEIDYLGNRSFIGGYDDLVRHLAGEKRLLNG